MLHLDIQCLSTPWSLRKGTRRMRACCVPLMSSRRWLQLVPCVRVNTLPQTKVNAQLQNKASQAWKPVSHAKRGSGRRFGTAEGTSKGLRDAQSRAAVSTSAPGQHFKTVEGTGNGVVMECATDRAAQRCAPLPRG